MVEKDTNMSEWLQLQRLERNDLPLPKYETEHSAGIDFGACLTRPCQHVLADGSRRKFLTTSCSTPTTVSTGRYFYSDPASPAGLLVAKAPSPSEIQKENDIRLIIQAQETIMVPLGWKCEFGREFVLNLHVRSSAGLKGLLLANSTGIVDPDYRGELFACLWNRTDMPIIVEHGQRIIQGVLLGFSQAIIKEAKALGESERGEGGFGSTGDTIKKI